MRILFISLFFFLVGCFSQNNSLQSKKLITEKYAGTYSYGTDVEKGSVGNIDVYPETDSTLLFYIDLNIGAPSYNSGALYARVKIINDTGTFYTKLDYMNDGCKWLFQFYKDDLKIKTLNGQYDCGFGNAVTADGDFKKLSAKPPVYFEDREGTKVYFKTTPPEEYNK